MMRIENEELIMLYSRGLWVYLAGIFFFSQFAVAFQADYQVRLTFEGQFGRAVADSTMLPAPFVLVENTSSSATLRVNVDFEQNVGAVTDMDLVFFVLDPHAKCWCPVGMKRFRCSATNFSIDPLNLESWVLDECPLVHDYGYRLAIGLLWKNDADPEQVKFVEESRVNAVLNGVQVGFDTTGGVDLPFASQSRLDFFGRVDLPFVVTPEIQLAPDSPDQFGEIGDEVLSQCSWLDSLVDCWDNTFGCAEAAEHDPNSFIVNRFAREGSLLKFGTPNTTPQENSELFRRVWTVRKIKPLGVDPITLEPDPYIETLEVVSMSDVDLVLSNGEFFHTVDSIAPGHPDIPKLFFYSVVCVDTDRFGTSASSEPLVFSVEYSSMGKHQLYGVESEVLAGFMPVGALDEIDPLDSPVDGVITTPWLSLQSQADLSIIVTQYGEDTLDSAHDDDHPCLDGFPCPGDLPDGDPVEEEVDPPDEIQYRLTRHENGEPHTYTSCDASSYYFLLAPEDNFDHFWKVHYFTGGEFVAQDGTQNVLHLEQTSFPISIQHRRRDGLLNLWSEWSEPVEVKLGNPPPGQVGGTASLGWHSVEPPFSVGQDIEVDVAIGDDTTNGIQEWYSVGLIDDEGDIVPGSLIGPHQDLGGTMRIESDSLGQPLDPNREYKVELRVAWTTTDDFDLFLDFLNFDGSIVAPPAGTTFAVRSLGPFSIMDSPLLLSLAIDVMDPSNQASIYEQDGTVNFRFLLGYEGSHSPVAIQWAWKKGNESKYFTGEDWEVPNSQENIPAMALLGDLPTNAFQHAWSTNDLGSQVHVTATSAPFAVSGLVDAFFTPDSALLDELDVQFIVRAKFSEGDEWGDDWISTGSHTIYRVVENSNIQAFSFATGDPTVVAPLGVDPPVADVDKALVVETSSTTGINFQVLLVGPGGNEHARIDDWFGQVQFNNGVYSISGAESVFISKFNSHGTYRLHARMSQDDLATPADPYVTYVVSEPESLSVRFHFRDQIGSSSVSRLYSGKAFGANAGDIELTASDGTPQYLYPHEPEYTVYKPYGEEASITSTVETDLGSQRFTDHEYDVVSGYNYMKGRYQLPVYAKFNRPDPMRDWDWLRPHTLNLYQYCGNDPINGWDPHGFKIRPADDDALAKLREIVSEDLREYIVLDEDGCIDRSTMESVETEETNFLELQQIVRDDRIVDFLVAPGFEYRNEEGEIEHVDFDFEPAHTEILNGQEVYCEEEAWYGVSQYPIEGDAWASPNENLRAVVSNLKGVEGTRAQRQTTAHELLGHILPFLLGKPFEHNNPEVDTNIKNIEERTK